MCCLRRFHTFGMFRAKPCSTFRNTSFPTVTCCLKRFLNCTVASVRSLHKANITKSVLWVCLVLAFQSEEFWMWVSMNFQIFCGHGCEPWGIFVDSLEWICQTYRICPWPILWSRAVKGWTGWAAWCASDFALTMINAWCLVLCQLSLRSFLENSRDNFITFMNHDKAWNQLSLGRPGWAWQVWTLPTVPLSKHEVAKRDLFFAESEYASTSFSGAVFLPASTELFFGRCYCFRGTTVAVGWEEAAARLPCKCTALLMFVMPLQTFSRS